MQCSSAGSVGALLCVCVVENCSLVHSFIHPLTHSLSYSLGSSHDVDDWNSIWYCPKNCLCIGTIDLFHPQNDCHYAEIAAWLSSYFFDLTGHEAISNAVYTL